MLLFGDGEVTAAAAAVGLDGGSFPPGVVRRAGGGPLTELGKCNTLLKNLSIAAVDC